MDTEQKTTCCQGRLSLLSLWWASSQVSTARRYCAAVMMIDVWSDLLRYFTAAIRGPRNGQFSVKFREILQFSLFLYIASIYFCFWAHFETIKTVLRLILLDIIDCDTRQVNAGKEWIATTLECFCPKIWFPWNFYALWYFGQNPP